MMNRLISSYAGISTAASTVARAHVGPTPFHSPLTPSAATILRNASSRPRYRGCEPGLMPSACRRTLMRSVGLQMADEIAPAPAPARTFFHSAGLLSCWSPRRSLMGVYRPYRSEP
eukprot:Amastigsp_a852585_6.p6 type:complete len:116 gc:universal Amastigsp_a852585_6:614-267(-)